MFKNERQGEVDLRKKLFESSGKMSPISDFGIILPQEFYSDYTYLIVITYFSSFKTMCS
jgi:hypothetical protein